MVIPIVTPIVGKSILLETWASILLYLILGILVISAIVWVGCLLRELVFDKDEPKVTKWFFMATIMSIIFLIIFLFIVVLMGVGVAS